MPLVVRMLPWACFILTLCALPLWNGPAFGAQDVGNPKPVQDLPLTVSLSFGLASKPCRIP